MNFLNNWRFLSILAGILMLVSLGVNVIALDVTCTYSRQFNGCWNSTSKDYESCVACKVKFLELLGGNIIVKTVNAQKDGKATLLSIESGTCRRVPREILVAYPEIINLIISKTKTETIDETFFGDSSGLKSFLSVNNPVRTLRDNSFATAFNLEIINFSFNELEVIDSGAFRSLNNLKYLYLSYNKIKEVGSWLKELGNLERLYLDKNKITSILTFEGLSNVKNIWLQGNQIKEIALGSFKLNKLAHLDLNNNICINKEFGEENGELLDFPAIKTELLDICGNKGCKIPLMPNGRVVRFFNNVTQVPNSDYEDYEPLAVICNPMFSLLIGAEDEKKIYCVNDHWDRVFPQCLKLCPISELTGLTIKVSCELNHASVPCPSHLQPGGMAHITCKTGYKTTEQVYKDLICLESGEWNHKSFKCEPVCGVVTPKAQHFIFSGQDANIPEVPWMVAVYRNDQQICGGTIISERIILSAAHCFHSELSKNAEKFQPSIFKIAAGKYFRELAALEQLSVQIMEVLKIITEQEFLGYDGFFLADIAVVILNDYLEYKPHIAPVCIEFYKFAAQRYPANGTEALVAGWGSTKINGKLSDVLQKIKIPTVDFNTCLAKAPEAYRPFVTFDKICAGFADGSGVCQGDSGGSLAISQVLGGKSVYYIQGIVSNGKFSQGGCDLGFFTMFTNVQEYSKLINNAIKDFPVQ